MIAAALVFGLAVLVGALLRCLLPPPPRYKDVTVNGHPVELAQMERFRVEIPRHASRLAVRRRADGTREVIEVPAWKLAASCADNLFAMVLHVDGLWSKKKP